MNDLERAVLVATARAVAGLCEAAGYNLDSKDITEAVRALTATPEPAKPCEECDGSGVTTLSRVSAEGYRMEWGSRCPKCTAPAPQGERPCRGRHCAGCETCLKAEWDRKAYPETGSVGDVPPHSEEKL